MMRLILVLFFCVKIMANPIMDLGNLDIKGNLNLPSYQLETNIFDLNSSLKKISRLEYEASATVDDINITSNKSELNNDLAEEFTFDLNIKKVRLD